MTSTTKAIMVECGRDNSIEAETFGVNDKRSGNNARWSNFTSIDLEPGDTINMEYAIIHQIGSDSQTTMEITGEPDKDTGLVDNKCLLTFSPYICNNGYNMCVQPMFAQGAQANWDYDQTSFASATSGFTSAKMYVTDIDGGHRYYGGGFEYGAVQDYGWSGGNIQCDFDTDPEQNVKPFSPFAVRWMHLTEGVNSIKYTKLRPDYQGPYKVKLNPASYPNNSYIHLYGGNTTPNGNPGLHWGKGKMKSDPDNLWTHIEEKYEIPIEIQGPSYETPDTICNTINEIFHRTERRQNPTDILKSAIDNRISGDPFVVLNHLNGPLFKSYEADADQQLNRPQYFASKFNGNLLNPLWGQIAVKDLDIWYGVHYFMRMEIGLEHGFINNDYKNHFLYPVYWWGLSRCVSPPLTENISDFVINNSLMCPYKALIVDSQSGDNGISTFNIPANTGLGYTIGDYVEVIEPEAGTKPEAYALFQVTDTHDNGAINGLNMIEAGSGYTVANNYRIIGGSGSNAYIDITAVASTGARINKWRHYATLPKNMIVPTNIKYTEENIKWIQKVFNKNAKYNGQYTNKNDIENDRDGWYVDFDIGRTADANNSLDDQPDPDGSQADVKRWTPTYNQAEYLVENDNNVYNLYGSALFPIWQQTLVI